MPSILQEIPLCSSRVFAEDVETSPSPDHLACATSRVISCEAVGRHAHAAPHTWNLLTLLTLPVCGQQHAPRRYAHNTSFINPNLLPHVLLAVKRCILSMGELLHEASIASDRRSNGGKTHVITRPPTPQHSCCSTTLRPDARPS